MLFVVFAVFLFCQFVSISLESVYATGTWTSWTPDTFQFTTSSYRDQLVIADIIIQRYVASREWKLPEWCAPNGNYSQTTLHAKSCKSQFF